MQAEKQSEREAFEARTRKLSPCANLSRQKEVFGGHYRTITIQREWEQWQAAVEWQKQQARAALSHPSTPQEWQCPKCGIEREGPLIACMQDGCPTQPEQGGPNA